MKELTLIRAPIRTDKINPIKSDNRIHLLVMSDYGCPENCFSIDFKVIVDIRVSHQLVFCHETIKKVTKNVLLPQFVTNIHDFRTYSWKNY